MTDAARRLFEERLRENGGAAERALAEVIQYITLLGLSRTDFFALAAFYGGTALRMLLGLDRFSEDLDFSLDRPRPEFSVERSLPASLPRFLLGLGSRVQRAGTGTTLPSTLHAVFPSHSDTWNPG